MVTIRLSRAGAKKKPFYRVVVADHRFPRDGRFIEQIGTYDPKKPDTEAFVQVERLNYWVGNGAQLSERVEHIIRAKKKAEAATASA